MLHEIRGEGFAYDASSDVVRVKAPGAAGAGRVGLFDHAGFLVGVDLRGPDQRGTVVMLGPHEAVAETRPLTFAVTADGLVIERARHQIRGHEQNPYV